ncbi:MAG: LuxR C-terminal-related transcriptional regulator, partial [Myxococcota bacterium]
STHALATRRDLQDYLMSEVLASQPEQVRLFLLRTSVLTRLSASTCDAVNGASTGAVVLNALDRDNLFLVPLDVEGVWWRYHHLFCAFLRARLAQEPGEDEAELHRRACAWMRAHDLPLEALRHACASGDQALLADVLLQFGRALLFRGEQRVLLGWYDKLDEEQYEASPMLCVYALWTMVLSRSFDRVDSSAVRTERALEAHPELDEIERAELRAFVHAARAFAMQDFIEHREETARQAELALEAISLVPGPHPVRPLANHTLGCVYFGRAQTQQALDAFTEASRTAAETGNIFLSAGSMTQWVRVLQLMGRFDEAVSVINELLAYTQRWGFGALGSSGYAFQNRAWIAAECGNLEEARALAHQAIDGHANVYQDDDLAHGFAILAMLQGVSGELDAMNATLAKAAAHANSQSRVFRLFVPAILAGHQADGDMLRRSLHAIDEGVVHDPEDRHWYTWLDVWRQVLEGEERAPEGIAAERAAALERDHHAYLAYWDALLALHWVKSGDEESARALRASLGTRLPGLLVFGRMAQAQTTASAPVVGSVSAKIFLPVDVEELSAREAEVLACVARGLSNKDTAAELFVTEGTIKTPVLRILRKLDVSNRTEAVHRARALGWLR